MFVSNPADHGEDHRGPDTGRIAMHVRERQQRRPVAQIDIRVTLASCAGAPRAAREAVQRLRGEIADHLLRDLELLVSEVVTNSVRHARVPQGAVIDLGIRVSPDRVRVVVSDDGTEFGPRPGPSEDRPGGWGLRIVERVADRVVTQSGDRTTVWFEIAR